MPFTLTFGVTGDEQFHRTFTRFADDVKDASEAFREISHDFHTIVEPRQFSSEGASGNSPWPALSTNYAAWKVKNFPGQTILVLGGQLREAAISEAADEIMPLQALLKVSNKLAVYHQFGMGRLPVRQVINLNEDDKTRWVKIFQTWLVGQANKEWAGVMPGIRAGQKAMGAV